MTELNQNCPIQWIEQEFIRRKQDRKQYSLRQFAKKIKIPPGRLSEILTKKRRLTPKLALRVAEGLELSPKQTNAFLKSVHLGPFNPKVDHEQEQVTLLKEDYFQLISEWYHFAILSLINTQNFNPDPQTIARRIGISVVEVRNALSRMEKLKLIRKTQGTWTRTQNKLTTTWDVPSAALRKSHRQELERAIESLEKVPVEYRDVSALTMAINPGKIPEAKKLIREFQTRMEHLLESGPQTEVYTLNIQLLPITQGVNK